jgi:hypothetical protein
MFDLENKVKSAVRSRWVRTAFAVGAAIFLYGCNGDQVPTFNPSPTSKPPPTATYQRPPTPAPTRTPRPTETATQEPTQTIQHYDNTPTPELIATQIPPSPTTQSTPTAEPSATPKPNPTQSPTVTPTATPRPAEYTLETSVAQYMENKLVNSDSALYSINTGIQIKNTGQLEGKVVAELCNNGNLLVAKPLSLDANKQTQIEFEDVGLKPGTKYDNLQLRIKKEDGTEVQQIPLESLIVPSLADLQLGNITNQKQENPDGSYNVDLTVPVINSGGREVKDAVVEVYRGDELLASKSMVSLSANSSVHETLQFPLTDIGTNNLSVRVSHNGFESIEDDNSVQVSVNIPNYADLKFGGSITYNQIGEISDNSRTYSVLVPITNSGERAVEGAILQLIENGQVVSQLEGINLQAGQSITVPRNIPLPFGNHELTAVLKHEGLEQTKQNNDSEPFNINALLPADLTYAEISGSNNLILTSDPNQTDLEEILQDGKTYYAKVKIHNRGQETSNPTTISFYRSSVSDGNKIGSTNVSAIEPGSSITINTPLELAEGLYSVVSFIDPNTSGEYGSGRNNNIRGSLVKVQSSYYSQFEVYKGIVIKANDQVDSRAFEGARTLLEDMLGNGRSDIVTRLPDARAEIAIIPRNAVGITIIPEWSHRAGQTFSDGRSYDELRGIGGTTDLPVTVISEESLFGIDPSYGNLEIDYHEFAHAIRNIGFTQADHTKVWNFYNAAKNRNLFLNTYSMTNSQEYWAEMSRSFLKPFTNDPIGGPSVILQKQPEMYAFLVKIYGRDPLQTN